MTDATRNSTFEVSSRMTLASRHRFAIADLREGLRLWRLAWSLAWLDIRLRYRGSMLGPFWLTISTGVMVASLGFLYSALFKMSLREYLPFLAVSQVLWAFLATQVSESCVAFTEAETVIRSMRMSFSMFAIRILMRNVLVLAHNICVIVAVFLILRIWPGANALAVVLALPLWIANSLALSVLLGGVCARFRDVMPIVNSVMQIAFFLTPVIWKPQQLGVYAGWLPLNPFFDLLEIVRGPLLGDIPPLSIWAGAVGYSAVLCGLSWVFFLRARGRIAFWM